MQLNVSLPAVGNLISNSTMIPQTITNSTNSTLNKRSPKSCNQYTYKNNVSSLWTSELVSSFISLSHTFILRYQYYLSILLYRMNF